MQNCVNKNRQNKRGRNSGEFSQRNSRRDFPRDNRTCQRNNAGDNSENMCSHPEKINISESFRNVQNVRLNSINNYDEKQRKE